MKLARNPLVTCPRLLASSIRAVSAKQQVFGLLGWCHLHARALDGCHGADWRKRFRYSNGECWLWDRTGLVRYTSQRDID